MHIPTLPEEDLWSEEWGRVEELGPVERGLAWPEMGRNGGLGKRGMGDPRPGSGYKRPGSSKLNSPP